MPKFSKKSSELLSMAHPDLQKILNHMIKFIDFRVVCTYRGREEQTNAVATGKSKLPWPKSKHNTLPSMAVDIVPYPVDYKNKGKFLLLAGMFMGIGKLLKEDGYITHSPRVGADFNMDNDPENDSFKDLPHLEII
jgi:peptidoglycan L-alanyl-D-glutamate endopeptidase CwlK